MSKVHETEKVLADTWHAAKRELDMAKARYEAITSAIRAEGVRRINAEARDGKKASSCRLSDIQVTRRAVLRAGVSETVEGIGERVGLSSAEELFEASVTVKLHSAQKLLGLLRAFGVAPERVCKVTETVKPVSGYWDKRREAFFTDAQLEALEAFEAQAFASPQVYKAKPKTSADN